MKIFKKFNQNTNCPICGTNKIGKAVLIPINNTINETSICEAIQVHLDCIDLVAFRKEDKATLIIQGFYENKKNDIE